LRWHQARLICSIIWVCDAEGALRQALRQLPDNADYHFDLARCLLMQGRWAEGWNEYEWRRKMGEFGVVSEAAGPRWDGRAHKDMILLVHAEQGLGDAIQFVRFAATARARVKKLVLVVPPQLKALLRSAPGVDEVVGYGEQLPAYHEQIPLLSLPQVLQAIPAPVGAYLAAPADRLARWQAWRAGIKGKLIGLNWQGNPRARADAGRSLHLAQLAALGEVPGITFVALQKGAALEQVADLPPGFPLITPPAPFDEGADAFLDTAALMQCCDLVLTTDTSVAHLAGALDQPCWVMLKHIPDWRWMLGRADTPWYGRMRLFHQPAPGAWDSVIAAVKQALLAGETVPAASLEQAVALHTAGKVAAAASAYEGLLELAPDNVIARHYLGVALHQQGRSIDGEAQIRRALAQRPDYAEAWGNLALTLKVQNRTQEAQEAFEKALQLNPNSADVHNNFGNLLNGTQRHTQALEHYQRAIALQPNRADGYSNAGSALGDLERYDEAVEHFRRALALKPDYVSAMMGLGKAYRGQNKTEAAIAVFREGLAIEPDNADLWSNLGVCYRELSRYPEALQAYDEALRRKPEHAECWSNRAIALHYTARFDEAEAAYRESLKLKPDRADAHFGLAAVQLTRGHWLEGWKEYEWRRRMKDSGPLRSFAQPLWDGAVAPDKTLFLFVEQGLGDTLQFMRFLRLAQARVGKVVLEIQPGLHRLISPALPGVEIIRQGEALPSFDLYAPLMSLPALLGITPETLPAPASYLEPEKKLVTKWAKKLPKGKLRVGLNWQGNPKASVDKGRSVALARLAPVLEVAGATFISLQKNAGAEQIEQLPEELRERIHSLGAEFDSGPDAFIDTAAVMASLDLVITTDTAIAHLAGALGRPCWVMLKFMPDWRWLFERTDCPWYPATRLCRQPAEGDWDAVASMVAGALRDLTGQ
jgi:tetratricopeptide (TPR) repeat protein/ADP-heptose:LPS heptosyltransferase